jgi:NAD(P)-dependent dehydrogenase (short-subunit alcohol dehydrogenase family)
MPLVVLTGATRGIGRAAAIELARRGADVAIVGRDPTRVDDTAREARAAASNGAQVHEHTTDLASLEQTRALAAQLLDNYPRIDVLANNAGAKFDSRHITSEGFERTFALNHLAPFLLTTLLAERLMESQARVITTSSDAHNRADLDLDDLQFERRRFKPWHAYGNSKLCNILFTRELQRRQPELTANCFHPGVIRTGFGKNDGALSKLSMTIAGPFLKSPEEGAKTLVYLALDPGAGDLKGQYLEKQRPKAPSKRARDDRLAAALWERSEQLTEAVRGR